MQTNDANEQFMETADDLRELAEFYKLDVDKFTATVAYESPKNGPTFAHEGYVATVYTNANGMTKPVHFKTIGFSTVDRVLGLLKGANIPVKL